MSSFISQRTTEIFQNASIDVFDTPPKPGHETRQQQQRQIESQQTLRTTIAGLHTPPTDEQLAKSLDVLNDPNIVISDDKMLTVGIEERVVAALYARSMETLLKQCLEVDREAQYWGDVERSRYNTIRFLVQSKFCQQ